MHELHLAGVRFITPAVPLQAPEFYRTFSMPAAGVTSAVLTVTGLGLYRALLNGQRVGNAYLTPGYNDYDAYVRCQSYDVTSLLQAQNRLAVVLGNGWYQGRFGVEGAGEACFGNRHLVRARLMLTQADGTKTVIETDESWRACASVIGTNGIYDGEVRNDLLVPDAQDTHCDVVEAPALEQACEPDNTPPIVEKMTLKPTLYVSPKGESILDFGQNMVGFVRFVNRLPAGEGIALEYSEVLQQGCFYRENLRSAKARYDYTSDGMEKEVEPYFTFYGFRYVRVSGPDTVRPEDFTGVVLCSDLRETLSVQTDSAKINRLLQNALWGQRGNFLDVPTDCPQRDERLGWTGDAQVFLNTACYQMDCKAFYTKFLRDLREEQTRYFAGDIPMYCPSLKHACGAGGPAWADSATIMPWQLYRHYGDKTLLAQHYPMMRDYVQTLVHSDAQQGGTRILRKGFAFGDWLAQDGATPQSFVGGTNLTFVRTIYYYNSVRLTALAATEIGRNQDAQELAQRAQTIRSALLDEFFAPSGRLCVDTQTAYVLALQFEVYRNKQAVLEGLQERLKRDLYRLKTGFLGTPYLLNVLLVNGLVNDAYRLLYNENFPGWLYAVNLGATTIWERWNSLLPDGTISGTGMNSLNHYAYGSVCEAIYAHMAGLQCGAHGWKTAVVAPRLNYRMKQMTLRFASPAGVYRVAWELCAGGDISLAVEIPTGASAEVHLPLHPEQLVCTVQGGAHTWRYQAAQVVCRPFSVHTVLMDLLENAQAREVLKQTMPQLLGAALGEESDLVAESPCACVEKLPFLRGAKLNEADVLLRAIIV